MPNRSTEKQAKPRHRPKLEFDTAEKRKARQHARELQALEQLLPTFSDSLPAPQDPEAILFGLNEEQYCRFSYQNMAVQAIMIFNLIGLKPPQNYFHVGHRFLDNYKKVYFTAHSPYTLRKCMEYLGKRIFWIPTIDEMMRQATYDGLRLSFVWYRRQEYHLYRISVQDTLFLDEEDAKSYLGPESEYIYTGHDLWEVVAITLAQAYKRRFEEKGIEYVTQPISVNNHSEILEPRFLTDQNAPPTIPESLKYRKLKK